MNKVDLLKEFWLWNPELIKQMQKTNHHYDNENLSPWHLEGDVWSHTMIAYNLSFNNINNNIGLSNSQLAEGIALLLHDSGKPRSMVKDKKKKKVGFYSHAYAGVQYTVDFVYYLKEKYNWKHTSFKFILDTTIYAVSHHLDIFNIPKEKFSNYVNHQSLLANILSNVVKFDKMGQINDVTRINKEQLSFETEAILCNELKDIPIKYNSTNFDDCKFIVMGGVPGVGKDYKINQFFLNPFVISFDSIRINTYLKDHPNINNIDSNILYKRAYDYCISNKIDLNIELFQQLKRGITEYGRVVISNTNTTRKARKTIINLIRQTIRYYKTNNKVFDNRIDKIGCLYVVAPFEMIKLRDNTRLTSDKSVGPMICNKFAFNQILPTIYEGFDYVEIINN